MTQAPDRDQPVEVPQPPALDPNDNEWPANVYGVTGRILSVGALKRDGLIKGRSSFLRLVADRPPPAGSPSSLAPLGHRGATRRGRVGRVGRTGFLCRGGPE